MDLKKEANFTSEFVKIEKNKKIIKEFNIFRHHDLIKHAYREQKELWQMFYKRKYFKLRELSLTDNLSQGKYLFDVKVDSKLINKKEIVIELVYLNIDNKIKKLLDQFILDLQNLKYEPKYNKCDCSTTFLLLSKYSLKHGVWIWDHNYLREVYPSHEDNLLEIDLWDLYKNYNKCINFRRMGTKKVTLMYYLREEIRITNSDYSFYSIWILVEEFLRKLKLEIDQKIIEKQIFDYFEIIAYKHFRKIVLKSIEDLENQELIDELNYKYKETNLKKEMKNATTELFLEFIVDYIFYYFNLSFDSVDKLFENHIDADSNFFYFVKHLSGERQIKILRKLKKILLHFKNML